MSILSYLKLIDLKVFDMQIRLHGDGNADMGMN